MRGGTQRSQTPGIERVVNWLRRKQRTESILLVASAFGMGWMGLLASFLVCGLLFLLVTLVMGRIDPLVMEGFAAADVLIVPFILSVSGFAALIVTYYRSTWRTTRFYASYGQKDLGSAGQTLTDAFAEVCFVAPWLIDEAVSLLVRAWRLSRIDALRCSQIFYLLATRRGRVSFAEVAAIIQGRNPWALFTMLRQIDGVVFLFKRTEGISVTDDLRSELRRLLGNPEPSGAEAPKFESSSSEAAEPWAILGVRRDATTDEVKAAYRKAIKLCHPDRFASASKDMVKLAEEQAKNLNAAYEAMLDRAKSNSRGVSGE